MVVNHVSLLTGMILQVRSMDFFFHPSNWTSSTSFVGLPASCGLTNHSSAAIRHDNPDGFFNNPMVLTNVPLRTIFLRVSYSEFLLIWKWFDGVVLSKHKLLVFKKSTRPVATKATHKVGNVFCIETES